MKFGHPFTAADGGVNRLFDRNADNLVTIESEGGLWQMQLNPTITGSVRLNVSHRDEWGTYLTAWCLGTDRTAITLIWHAVRRILEAMPEESDPVEFERTMPRHSREVEPDGKLGRELRPIATDPVLIIKLGRLAGLSAAESGALCGSICEPAVIAQAWGAAV